MKKITNLYKSLLCSAMATALLTGAALAHEDTKAHQKQKYALVIHGGAGTILKKNMTPEKEQAYHAKMGQALRAGQAILAKGGAAVDAVVATIKVMEDSPLFNAAKGAVFNHQGKNEMDSSIMDGRTLNAGAVAGVEHVKNPIILAREVMINSKHVMLAGKGAEIFAKTRGIELVDAKYFHTERRFKQLQGALKAEKMAQNNIEKTTNLKLADLGYDPQDPDRKFGTVGAAALDIHGNIAAGTSTGGMTNKRWNRIGDSPVIGAGTYADNNSCAISSTGHGEYFIRAVVAYSICAMMEYKGVSLQEAADAIVMKKLVKMGGTGGIIALDAEGNIAMTFNTAGMYRGYIKGQGKPVTKIYKD